MWISTWLQGCLGVFFHQSCYLKKWGNYMQNLFQRLSLRLWSQAWKIESEAPCFLLISQCITLCDLLHWKIVILNCYIEFLWGILPFWTVYNDHMRGFCFFFIYFLFFNNCFKIFLNYFTRWQKGSFLIVPIWNCSTVKQRKIFFTAFMESLKTTLILNNPNLLKK